LIEHSSHDRVHVSKMYSLNSHHNDSKLWVILASYFAVVALKTVVCIVIYRLRWDNLNDRTLLNLFPTSISKPANSKRTFKVETSNVESHKRENTPREAIKLFNVCKQIAGSESGLNGVSMSILYDQVNVLYSANEFKSMTVLCKLCAGFSTPDSGEVHLYGAVPRCTTSVIASYIHSVSLRHSQHPHFKSCIVFISELLSFP